MSSCYSCSSQLKAIVKLPLSISVHSAWVTAAESLNITHTYEQSQILIHGSKLNF
jgi:hypothetical protein